MSGKAVTARFDSGWLSSDSGLLALPEVERRLGVAGRMAACIDEFEVGIFMNSFGIAVG